MSPILVRPVREQLEHDRVIRLLQAKYKRKFEVAINPGNEQGTPVGTGPSPWYPDLVLMSTERARKLVGVVEVETAESVNNLEAMSQWASFAKLRTAFHLYVPTSSIDTAKRLCQDLQIVVAEFWAYHGIGDQIRFTLVQRAAQPADGTRPAAALAASNGEAGASSGERAPASRAASSSARTRSARPAAAPARPARRPSASSGARRPAAAKSKSAAPRRSAKPAARKTAAPASRAQKRR